MAITKLVEVSPPSGEQAEKLRLLESVVRCFPKGRQQRVPPITAVRIITGWGLKESKDFVDTVEGFRCDAPPTRVDFMPDYAAQPLNFPKLPTQVAVVTSGAAIVCVATSMHQARVLTSAYAQAHGDEAGNYTVAAEYTEDETELRVIYPNGDRQYFTVTMIEVDA